MVFSSDRFLRLTDLLEALRSECEGACNLLLCRALAVEIFALIDRFGGRETVSSSLPSHMLEIRRYVDEHFREISSVPELAARFFYTREHLTRLFKKYYNMSVSSYLIRCRIRFGAALLREGCSVTRAALDCGFGSISAFSCAFRKEYGMPPREYSSLYDKKNPKIQ